MVAGVKDKNQRKLPSKLIRLHPKTSAEEALINQNIHGYLISYF
jgi:hypothetical protein